MEKRYVVKWGSQSLYDVTERDDNHPDGDARYYRLKRFDTEEQARAFAASLTDDLYWKDEGALISREVHVYNGLCREWRWQSDREWDIIEERRERLKHMH